MIYFIIICIILLILYKKYDPYIDVLNGYKKLYVILWYNSKGKRKYINLIGG